MGYSAPYERIDWTTPRTQDEWKALAADLRQQAYSDRKSASDSFERCDTDGFLSQWASNVTAQAYELAASIAENGGRIEVKAVFTLDGEFVTADLRDGQYGLYYLVSKERQEALGITKPFINWSKASNPKRRAATYASKGYRIGTIRIAPYVTMGGGNLASVRAYAEPSKTALKEGDFEVLATKWGDRLDTTAGNSADWREWTDEEMAATA